MKHRIVWGYERNSYGHLSEPYETREEALEAGKKYFAGGEEFDLHSGHLASVFSYVPGAESFLDVVAENKVTYSDDHERRILGRWPRLQPLSKQAVKEYEEFMESWVERHCPMPPHWVINTTETIPAREVSPDGKTYGRRYST